MAQVSGTGRGKNLRSTSSRKVAFAVGLLFAVLGGLFVSFAPTAQAAATATPIVDYIHYPVFDPSLLPAGCTVSGAAVLSGIQYIVKHDNVDSAPSSDLTSFSLVTGDTVTMTWADYTSGCEGIGVSLAVKSTQHPIFVPEDNQHLVSFAFCSGVDCGTATAFGHLSITIPERTDACNFQLDAVIGPPLANVGPSGSYYNNFTRGANSKPHGTAEDLNMLIGSNNGGEGKCIIPPTATATISCAAEGGPGADVAINNPDDDDVALVDVLKDGVVVNSGVTVPTLGTTHITVPFDANETATVSVNDTIGGTVTPGNEIFSSPFTADCVHLGATITHSCADGGVDVDFTNTGPVSSPMTVTKAGLLIDTVTVPGNGTAHRVYPMAEDETATYRVTGLGFDSGNLDFTHDCVLAGSTTTTVPDTVLGTEIVRGTTLPQTGSGSTMGLSTMAGLLLMTGGLLLALANRPMPTTATATTRSRGR